MSLPSLSALGLRQAHTRRHYNVIHKKVPVKEIFGNIQKNMIEIF